MRKTFKYRLLGDKAVFAKADSWLYHCRWLYNVALEQRISIKKAMLTKCEFTDFFFNKLSSLNFFGFQFGSQVSYINQVILEFCSKFNLSFLNPNVWVYRLKEIHSFFRHNSPLPAISLKFPTRCMGIVRYVSTEYIVKPFDEFLICICNSYLKPMTKNFVISARGWFTNSYYDRPFTIKQTSHIANRINVNFIYHTYKHAILCSKSQESCGVLHDRDYNAAKNINTAGQAVQELTYANR